MLDPTIADDDLGSPGVEQPGQRQELSANAALTCLLVSRQRIAGQVRYSRVGVVAVRQEAGGLDQLDDSWRAQARLEHRHDVVVLRVDGVPVLVENRNAQHRGVAVVEQQAEQRRVHPVRLPGEVPLDQRLAPLAHTNTPVAVAFDHPAVEPRQPDGIHAVSLAELDQPAIPQPGIAHQDDVDRLDVREHTRVAGHRGQCAGRCAESFGQIVAHRVGAGDHDTGGRQLGQIGDDAGKVDRRATADLQDEGSGGVIGKRDVRLVGFYHVSMLPFSIACHARPGSPGYGSEQMMSRPSVDRVRI